ncbi:MAG: dienelactone hydrolase family protein [Pseudomonadota bacterium]|nr:dienelactone hydrolase family protein [Pseudomonadota bacterium]
MTREKVMGEAIKLSVSDGFEIGGYRADPEKELRGGVVVIQEIFGVNVHIRDVCERYAALGYRAVAPALYDRYEPGFEIGYSAGDISIGREFKAKANENFDDVLKDVNAAHALAAEAGRVGIIGFCWGGVVTWAAACRLDFQAASSFYGAGIIPMLDGKPNCPTILHFGSKDASIPMDEVEQIAATHPDCPIHIYDAGHGFNCDRRGDYSPHSAAISAMRTIRLFDEQLDQD